VSCCATHTADATNTQQHSAVAGVCHLLTLTPGARPPNKQHPPSHVYCTPHPPHLWPAVTASEGAVPAAAICGGPTKGVTPSQEDDLLTHCQPKDGLKRRLHTCTAAARVFKCPRHQGTATAAAFSSCLSQLVTPLQGPSHMQPAVPSPLSPAAAQACPGLHSRYTHPPAALRLPSGSAALSAGSEGPGPVESRRPGYLWQ
jgi:hypothetical protein